MILKRITLHGFKSFADRTDFEFGRGMTGIVGPNGCGKSNVLDALRWVLGEQSAKALRGRNMLDIVFSGSRSRKPANHAEVELVFDNEDGTLGIDEKEVTVGRVLYRSGDSEYRLNGNLCRLRDVRDLLLDTGVGVDAYSVIEQGRVDAMLNANPQQRREIFEEAAGISRYKVRRLEAQRKLERTHTNLLRLNDVVEELEKRLRSVKLAAGKARRFQEYDVRLRELRSTYSLAEYNQLSKRRESLRDRSESISDVLGARRAELASRDADAAEFDHELQRLDEEIRSAEAESLKTQTELSAIGERIEQGGRRIAELTARREQEAGRGAEALREADSLQSRLDEAQREIAELEKAEQSYTSRVDELARKRADIASETARSRSDLGTAQKASFEAARHSTHLANEQHNLQEQRGRLEQRILGLSERQQQLDGQLHDLRTRRSELEQLIEALDRETADASAALGRLDEQLADLERRSVKASQTVATHKESRSAVVSRLELLEDMESRYEGLERGPRWVLEWSREDPRVGGVLGLVADLLRIDDPRVGVLQTLLARCENYIVVSDSHAFLAELGRRGDAPGPVEVLALDRLASPQDLNDYAAAVGFVARAVDWVHCDAALRSVAEYVFGRVIVVETHHAALGLAGEAPEGYTFVSLDGYTVESGGRITAGVAEARSVLFSRKSEIREAQAERDNVETELERATRAQYELEQQVSDARIQRESLLQNVAAVQKKHADARNEGVRLDDEAVRIERELGVLASESAEIRRSLGETDRRGEQVGVELAAIQENQQRHDAKISAVEQELGRFDAVLAELSSELTEAQVQAGRAAERCAARSAVLDELRQREQALRQEHERAIAQAEQAAEQIDKARRELAESERRLEELRGLLQKQERHITARRGARQKVRRRIESCGAVAKLVLGEIEQTDEVLRECDIELRDAEVRTENLVSRVSDELGLDLARMFETYRHVEQDWAAIQTEIDELRGKISRLGNVNLDAIKELDELTPRYENLTAQRDDLLSSIARLESLIAELDEESRSRFTAAFTEIRGNFQELFRKLFGGGKADIILEDPEAPLECGIEIIARPPGKEARSISLLSGGERTMAAVALLFAVFRSKPSPFAILDEVDAALDESNIDRFNAMLMDFLSRSQFIVITHSKNTMQCADVLYGVTMEEPGVSKRVSVRFDRVETPNVA